MTPTLGAIFTGVNCPAWVGIGTDSPTASLDVRGKGFFASDLQVVANASKMVIGAASSQALGHGTSYLGFNAQRFGSTNGIWQTSSDGSHNGGAVIYGDIFGSLRFATLPNTNTPGQGQNTVLDATVAENTRLFIHRDGNIGIGTVTPTATLAISADATQITKSLIVKDIVSGKDVFRVLSDGHVWATELDLALKEDFPDYVFDNSYKLMSLVELEKYIIKNKHLPNIPTATQIKEKGMRVGEMQVKQMEKIEELTLYVIELSKQIELLKIENEKLKVSINH